MPDRESFGLFEGPMPLKALLLLLLLLALTLDVPKSSPVFHPRPALRPAGAADLSPAGAGVWEQELALVFFGTPGAHTNEEKTEIDAGRRSAHIDIPLLTFPTVLDKVVRFNKQNGWRSDIFYHTWEVNQQEGLYALYRPTAFAAGNAELNGRFFYEGMGASMELALNSMWDYVKAERNGRPYDRILLLRFDLLFFSSFNVSKLEREDTLYFSNWCKATGTPSILPPPEPGWDCRTLVPSYFEREGVPDFYFAGSNAVMQRMFKRLEGDFLDGLFKNTALGMYHGKLLSRMWHVGVPVGHYMVHHMDLDVYRFAVCHFIPHCRGGNLWEERGSLEPTYGFANACAGRSYCSCTNERISGIPHNCTFFAFGG